MPQMTGIELLTEVRKLQKATDQKMIPFVFITSESTIEMRQKATESGAIRLISKPFSADVFEKKLAGIID